MRTGDRQGRELGVCTVIYRFGDIQTDEVVDAVEEVADVGHLDEVHRVIVAECDVGTGFAGCVVADADHSGGFVVIGDRYRGARSFQSVIGEVAVGGNNLAEIQRRAVAGDLVRDTALQVILLKADDGVDRCLSFGGFGDDLKGAVLVFDLNLFDICRHIGQQGAGAVLFDIAIVVSCDDRLMHAVVDAEGDLGWEIRFFVDGAGGLFAQIDQHQYQRGDDRDDG